MKLENYVRQLGINMTFPGLLLDLPVKIILSWTLRALPGRHLQPSAAAASAGVPVMA